MRKREEFAVSLRKQKKQRIIQERRKRLKISSQGPAGQDCANDGQYENEARFDTKMYDRCPIFQEEVNAEHPGRSQLASFDEIMMRVIPDLPACLQLSQDRENFEQVTACKILQINMLLGKLFSNDEATQVTPIDQLAMILKIRKILGMKIDQ